jgi:3-dehydroquinate synthase
MLEKQIIVNLPAKAAYNYPIFIDEGLISNWQDWLIDYAATKKIVIITDKIVCKLYAKQFAANLEKAGYDVLLLDFAPGEEAKNFANFEYLLNEMLINKCDRHTLCVAIGGGVVGDLTGFVASVFMRGIRYIQIPTTLLSMIDSSVGGKTAVNSVHGKNLIGAFYQPGAVVMDIELLKTLPQQHLINGLIEAIKIFLTSDGEYFKYIQANLEQVLVCDKTALTKIIKRAVELKAEVVAQDEREQNQRMSLNFGHTVGHAVEKVSKYTIMHGYAVALGILVEAKISFLLGILSHQNYQLIEKLMQRLDIDTRMLQPFAIDNIVMAMHGDKKNKAGDIYMILLADIGKIKLSDGDRVATIVSEDIIRQALIGLMPR